MEQQLKEIEYVEYVDESMISDIQALVAKDLSEPYSIFTYRYFLHNWPSLCICAYDCDATSDENGSSSKFMIGTIVGKAEDEQGVFRGYIAMLAVNSEYRKRGIGAKLSSMVLDRMVAMGCEEITLETEASNQGALRLYERLGFLRDEKMTRYYLNSGDAYRLKLFVDPIVPLPETNENAITNTTGDDSVAISDNITIPDDTLGDSTAMSEVVNVASASDGIIADGHNDVANTLETLSIGHEN